MAENFEQLLVAFLKQFQTPREGITGQELANLQGAAYAIYKQLTDGEALQSETNAIKVRFTTDKEYNIMWECTVLLLVQDILRNIIPAISTTVPQQELQEVKDKLGSWINKLSSRIEVLNPQ